MSGVSGVEARGGAILSIGVRCAPQTIASLATAKVNNIHGARSNLTFDNVKYRPFGFGLIKQG